MSAIPTQKYNNPQTMELGYTLRQVPNLFLLKEITSMDYKEMAQNIDNLLLVIADDNNYVISRLGLLSKEYISITDTLSKLFRDMSAADTHDLATQAKTRLITLSEAVRIKQKNENLYMVFSDFVLVLDKLRIALENYCKSFAITRQAQDQVTIGQILDIVAALASFRNALNEFFADQKSVTKVFLFIESANQFYLQLATLRDQLVAFKLEIEKGLEKGKTGLLGALPPTREETNIGNIPTVHTDDIETENLEDKPTKLVEQKDKL